MRVPLKRMAGKSSENGGMENVRNSLDDSRLPRTPAFSNDYYFTAILVSKTQFFPAWGFASIRRCPCR
ncbi:MAG: hypothetical protein AB7O62_09650 [Pirellulales bacterium]